MDTQDGLILAFILDGRGGGKAIPWDLFENWHKDQGALWVHCDYSNTNVQHWLTEKSGLPRIIVEALQEEETRPRCVSEDEGLLVILRGVNCNPGADPEDMVAIRMFFTESRAITMRQRKVMAIDDINQVICENQGPASISQFLSGVCERLTDRLGNVINDIDDKVDALEDEILTAESNELRSSLLLLRRQAISLRRYIAPQRDVMKRLYQDKVHWLTEADRLQIRETAERTARFVEDIDAIRDRTAIMSEELNNRLSEQMNKAMYLLSIVTATFLPLGLITGLLGINVGGIPGADFKWAFAIVTFMLFIVALILLLIFKRIKWI